MRLGRKESRATIGADCNRNNAGKRLLSVVRISEGQNGNSSNRTPLSVVQVSTGGVRLPPTGYGGIERHILKITEQLSRKGVRVTLIDRCFNSSDPSFSLIGTTPMYRVGSRMLRIARSGNDYSGTVAFLSEKWNQITYTLQTVMLIRTLLSRQAIDVIHFHSSLIGVILCLSSKTRERSVYTIHSILHSPDYKSSGLAERVNMMMDVWLGRHVRHLITINPAQRLVFVDRYGLQAKDVSFISNGTDLLPSADLKLEGIRAKFGMSDRFVILHVAKFSSQKGTEILIQAANVLANQRGLRNILFLLVGRVDTAFALHLRRLVIEKKLESVIRFTGVVSNNELMGLYHLSDVFVLPSTADAFDITVLEAMAAGKPIIGTLLSGMSLQVRNGWNGILLKNPYGEGIADAISYLLENDGIRVMMSNNSRVQARKFSWETVASSLIDVYEKSRSCKNHASTRCQSQLPQRVIER